MFVNWSKGMVDSVWFEVWKAEYGWLDIVSIQQKYGWQTRIWSVTLTSHHHYPVRQKVVSVCNSLVWPFPCLLFPISIADQHFSNLQCFKFVLKTNNQQQEQTNKKHALSPRHKILSDPGVPGIRSMGPSGLGCPKKLSGAHRRGAFRGPSNTIHPFIRRKYSYPKYSSIRIFKYLKNSLTPEQLRWTTTTRRRWSLEVGATTLLEGTRRPSRTVNIWTLILFCKKLHRFNRGR